MEYFRNTGKQILGIHEATGDDMRPDKPKINVSVVLKDAKLSDLSRRLYSLIDSYECDHYMTVDDFRIDLEDDPLSVIEYLVGRIESLEGVTA